MTILEFSIGTSTRRPYILCFSGQIFYKNQAQTRVACDAMSRGYKEQMKGLLGERGRQTISKREE